MQSEFNVSKLSRAVLCLKRLWLSVFLLVALVFVTYTLTQNKSSVLVLWRADFYTIFIALMLYVGYLISTVMTWRWLVCNVSGHQLSVRDSFVQIVTVNLGKYIPGKIWGLAARGNELHRHNVKTGHVIEASITEQYYLLYTATIIGIIGFGLISDSLMIWMTSIGVLLLFVTSHIWFKLFYGICLKIYGHVTSRSLSISPMKLSISAEFILRYLVVWVLLGLSFAAVTFSVTDLNPSAVNLMWLVVANTIAYVVGFIALFAPGGIGVRESVAAGILIQIMPFQHALKAVVAYRVFIVIVELVAGVLVSPRLIAATKSVKKTENL